MKIALLTPITIKDFQKYFEDKLPNGYPYPLFVPIVNYYIEKGHEVIICTTDRKIKKSKVFRSDRLTIFVAKSMPYSKLSALINFSFEINEIYKFLKNTPCDIYHANWTYEFALAALKVNKKKSLITIHDWAPKIYEYFNDYYRKKKLEISDKVYKIGENFTYVSPYIEKSVTERYKKLDINLDLIPNCIKYSISGKEELNKNFIIISINNGFDNRKNVKNLIKAFSLIREYNSNSTLKLFGNGYGINEEAYNWAKENSLFCGIEFKGNVNHNVILEELKLADLLIHPSLEESFGMIFLEAMITKTAIIAGKDSGAVPWVLENGRVGALVDVNNPNDIAMKAIEILSSYEKWKYYVNEGIRRARDFSIEKIGDMYLECYKKIINNEIKEK